MEKSINNSATASYSPPASVNENIGEKPLSPVLNKKRFNRKLFLERKVYKKSPERQAEASSNASEHCGQKSKPRGAEQEKICDKSIAKFVDKRTSSIPIPIKDGNFESKRSISSKKEREDDLLLTPSAILEFKTEVINKCTLADNANMRNEFETPSGKSISISEGKIREYTELFADILNINNKAESESYVKNMRRENKFPRHPNMMLPKNIELKCASGDTSEDSVDFDTVACLKERTHYINGEYRRHSNLNMLYENKEFEMSPTSKTTLFGSVEESESIDALERKCQIECYSNNYRTTADSADSICRPRTPHINVSRLEDIRDRFCLLSKNIDEEQEDKFDENFMLNKNINMSQLNYNVGADESNSTLEQEIKELEKLFEQRLDKPNERRGDGYIMGTQETNMYFSNISQYETNLVENQNKYKIVQEPMENTNTVDAKLRASSKNIINVHMSPSTIDDETHLNYKGTDCAKINSLSIQNRCDLQSKNPPNFCGFSDEQIQKTEKNYEMYNNFLLEYEKRITEKMKRKASNRKCKSTDKHSNTSDNFKDGMLPPHSKKVRRNAKRNLESNNGTHESLTEESVQICTNENGVLVSSKRNIAHTVATKDNFHGNSTTGTIHNDLIGTTINTSANTPSCMPDKYILNESCEKNLDETLVPSEQGVKIKKGPKKTKIVLSEVATDSSKVTENSSVPNTISLPSNNRVQICIGNNRIKINIKAEGDKQIESDNGSIAMQGIKKLSNKENLNFTEHKESITKKDYKTEICENLPPLPFCDGLMHMGFKTSSGKSIKIPQNALQDAEKFFEETVTAHASERKMLKPKSLLKARPEIGRPTHLQGGSRKSLNLPDSVSQLQTDSDILEFGKMDNFNFDLKSNGFALASGKKVVISTETFQKAINLYKEVAKDTSPLVNDSKSGEASKTIKQCNANRVIPDTSKSGEPSKTINQCRPTHLQHGSRKSSKLPDRVSQLQTDSDMDSKDILEFGKMDNFNFDFKSNGFALASGKQVVISTETFQKAINLYNEVAKDTSPIVNNSKTSEASKTINQYNENRVIPDDSKSGEASKTINQCNENRVIPDNKAGDGNSGEINNSTPRLEPKCPSKTAPELIQDVVSTYDSALEKFAGEVRPSNAPYERNNYDPRQSVSKKRLGMGRCKPVVLSKGSMVKAKQLLDDTYGKSTIAPCTKFAVFNSTPVKVSAASKHDNTFSPINKHNFNTSTPNKANCEAVHYKDTPIKTGGSGKKEEIKDSSSDDIIFQEKSCSDFKQLQNDIDKEYLILKKKLDVLEERKVVLEFQQNLIENGTEIHRRPQYGILTCKKRNSQRVALKNLFNSGDDNVDYFNVAPHIFEVTPKNAEKLHFNIGSTNDNVAIIKTSDGATIIPNAMNMVGLTEIGNAFQAMESVNPKLLARGWLQNHYKLIVWKLASYERRFPQYFKDCLCIENIVQQLKFRYDTEIDQVRRPALRKILEKDDVPQKRIVLCVSDIIQVLNNKFELELTDGWYTLKAAIDPPLMQQIYTNKIKIGTKLITQGAELLNCDDGCHPLEAMDCVRLKIGYNNTRRASWHTKLGYYKYPTPFPVHLSTLHPDGGAVGHLKILIARVYPLQFVETLDNTKIWRNEKAEEKRSREFEADKSKQLESLTYKALQEYETKMQQTHARLNQNLSKNEISKITCAKTLLNLIQNRDDAAILFDMLSPAQQRNVIEYKEKGAPDVQIEMDTKTQNEIEQLKLNIRSVTRVLTLLVMDASESNDKPYILKIWKPAEEHLHMLKEESTFSVYNLNVKKRCELQSSSRTFFKQNKEMVNNVNIQRQLLPIAITVDNYYKPLFNEFDTVGLIVQMIQNDFDQELWLSDFVGRLLYVRIIDGPKICSLLDNLKRGQTIAISNLIKTSIQNDFGIAKATQFTTISQYPSQKYLQHGLELFNQQLTEDVSRLLVDCDSKIKSINRVSDYKSTHHYKNNSLLSNITNVTNDDSCEDNSIIPSRLTMTDVAMSLIDTDQFN